MYRIFLQYLLERYFLPELFAQWPDPGGELFPFQVHTLLKLQWRFPRFVPKIKSPRYKKLTIFEKKMETFLTLPHKTNNNNNN